MSKALARHRKRLKARGVARLEVRVPRIHADVVKRVAAALQQGDAAAAAVEKAIDRALNPKRETGAEFLARLRSGPKFPDDWPDIPSSPPSEPPEV